MLGVGESCRTSSGGKLKAAAKAHRVMTKSKRFAPTASPKSELLPDHLIKWRAFPHLLLSVRDGEVKGPCQDSSLGKDRLSTLIKCSRLANQTFSYFPCIWKCSENVFAIFESAFPIFMVIITVIITISLLFLPYYGYYYRNYLTVVAKEIMSRWTILRGHVGGAGRSKSL